MTRLPPLAPNAALRYDVIQRLLPPGVTDVLEIGCGMGGVGARLAEQYRYVGLEPDAASYTVAAARIGRSPTGEVRNSDLSGLKDDETFDLVCAFEVLEHIEDDRGALAAWLERLRPGGWLLLSTPAHQRRFGPADVMAGHFRRYDPLTMAALLREAGLVDEQVVVYGMPLGYLLEAGRNAIGRRRLERARQAQSMAERTGGSGRILQPSNAAVGLAIHAGTLPFRLIQRAFPRTGTGLIARARKPPQSA